MMNASNSNAMMQLHESSKQHMEARRRKPGFGTLLSSLTWRLLENPDISIGNTSTQVVGIFHCHVSFRGFKSPYPPGNHLHISPRHMPALLSRWFSELPKVRYVNVNFFGRVLGGSSQWMVQWLGSPPSISHEWKGPHNRILRGQQLTMVINHRTNSWNDPPSMPLLPPYFAGTKSLQLLVFGAFDVLSILSDLLALFFSKRNV